MDGQQDRWEVIFRSQVKRACSERALVLAAAGIKFEIVRDAADYVLLAAAADAERAVAELDSYGRENRTASTRPAGFPHLSSGWPGVYGYVAIVLLVDILDDRDVFGIRWSAVGKTHAESILNGQWWRSVTALTLHADSAHLVANVIVGGLFGLFAGQLLGSGVAWLSILAAGAMGNLLNAWIQPARHTSIGASTAVFAALGLVAAFAWDRRRHLHLRAFARWTPLVGGGVLLGYLGAGGVRTDVAAHLAGFCCGTLLGMLFSRLGNRAMFSARTQFASGAAAVAMVAIAWAMAITTGRTPLD